MDLLTVERFIGLSPVPPTNTEALQAYGFLCFPRFFVSYLGSSEWRYRHVCLSATLWQLDNYV